MQLSSACARLLITINNLDRFFKYIYWLLISSRFVLLWLKPVVVVGEKTWLEDNMNQK